MSQYKNICIYGFALFAMFFGSGNLVFPIRIGEVSGSNWLYSFIGLFLTGTVLPFLGLFVVKLHRGSYLSFFAEAGFLAKIILPLFTISLLGSFGVLPRCITVAYGGVNSIFSDISLGIFSFIFSVLTYLLCLKEQRIIQIIGKWMSPILLAFLAILIVVGFIYAPVASLELAPSGFKAFSTGFLTGYQTMDLFAAFFFSSLTFMQIKKSLPSDTKDEEVIKFAVKSSIIAGALLSIVYLGFVFLGANFSFLIANIQPEMFLPTISSYLLGDSAKFIVGITMLLSCLTTAIALNNIYARYLCNLFKAKERYFPYFLACTTVTSFVISFCDFSGIVAFLAPILEVSYPGIIMLTIFSIITRKFKLAKKILFYGSTLLMLIYQYLY